LFNANSAIYQLYHGENKLHFNHVCFVLEQHVQSDFYSAISQKQQSMMGRQHASPLWHNTLNLSQTVFAPTP